MTETKKDNISVRMTFGGVSFKTSKNAGVRKPTVVKILRSGKVRVTCNGHYTDDYAFDAAYNFRRGELSEEAVLELANSIERSPSGWWCSAWQVEDKTLRLGCHSFKSYTLECVA